MSESKSTYREGSLEAPTRHPIDWRGAAFYGETELMAELERVYDICAGCRRCVSLCNTFPTLFDLVDASTTFEVDGVDKNDFWKVVDQCYLCDLCYMTKCPYVPPHEWNVDFPHLMLRGKAVKFKRDGATARDKLLTSTDAVGKLASLPVIANVVNAVNKNGIARKALQGAIGVHAEAPLPAFHTDTARKRLQRMQALSGPADRIGLFVTCFGDRNAPQTVDDMVAVFEHNDIAVEAAESQRCCGMPKLELGDLATVEKLKAANIPALAELAAQGLRITASIPSCVLMYRQELPLMFPDDEAVRAVGEAFVDPFEYLMGKHAEGQLKTDFNTALGKVAYHAACHQRVQNIGPKTKQVLELVPDTEVFVVERCSGHDGTYAVKKENYAFAKKICRPVVKRIDEGRVDHYVSDCSLAGSFIEQGVGDGKRAASVFGLLRKAYGL